MTENSDEIKDKVRELKNKLAEAKVKGPSAVEKVMSDIDRSGLPSFELDALMKEAKVAMASAIEVEKKLILGARAEEAKIVSKETGLSEWDQHVNKIASRFPTLNTELKKTLEENRELDKVELNNLKAGKGISEDYIRAKENQLKNGAEELLWKEINEAERVMNLKRQIGELRKAQIEEQARLEKKVLHEEHKDPTKPLDHRKEQLKAEWDKHNNSVIEAKAVLNEIELRYADKAKDAKSFTEVVELSKAQGISAEDLKVLQQWQAMDNKILNSRHINLQTQPTPAIGNTLKSDSDILNKTTKPNEKALNAQGQVSAQASSTLKNPNVKKDSAHIDENIIQKAKEMNTHLQPNLTHVNPPKNKEGRLQTTIPTMPTKIKPREL